MFLKIKFKWQIVIDFTEIEAEGIALEKLLEHLTGGMNLLSYLYTPLNTKKPASDEAG